MTSDEQVNWRSSIPFLGLHLVPFAALWTGVTAGDLWLCAALYLLMSLPLAAAARRLERHWKTSAA